MFSYQVRFRTSLIAGGSYLFCADRRDAFAIDSPGSLANLVIFAMELKK
jgi:hypothetical protein